MNIEKENRIESILTNANNLRWKLDEDFHDSIIEALYKDANRIADKSIIKSDKQPRFNVDQAIDRIVTSRLWGFPIMLLLLSIIFWVTIEGANVPSAFLFSILIDTFHPALKDFGTTIGFPLAGERILWLDSINIFVSTCAS